MENKINHIPLLRLLAPFVIGIISVIYIMPNTTLLLSSFGTTIIMYIGILLIKKINTNYKLRWVIGVLIYLNFGLAGACLTAIKFNGSNDSPQLLSKDNNQILIGEIIKPTQIKEKTVKAILKIKGIRNRENWSPVNGKVIVYLQKDSLSQFINVGDIISFEPKLENVPPPKNPNEFDYRKYLSFHLIHQQTFLRSNNWKLLKKGAKFGIFKLADDTRKYLINTLERKGIHGQELAVASALILGYKDNIDAQLKSAYSSAGAMHVLAVSGLHVGIIFLIFKLILSFLEKYKYGRILKGIILIIILWSYALLTGFSPSVMRAATMFTFIVAAKMTKRNSNFFNTLSASALALLIYNPLLIMEVGFQLSYLAVIGIVIIQPWINNWVTFKYWLPRKVWELTAVSIAAQIATFPLGLLYFHQFPNYFMLSNLIVIPMAIFILYLGLSTLCFSFIPYVGDYLAILLQYAIRFLNSAVKYIDKLPYSLTQNIRFSVSDAWLIYLFILSIIALIAYRKYRYVLLGGTLLIIFLFLKILTNQTDINQRKLVVYNIPQFSAINFIDGRDNILISDFKLTENRSKLLFHVQNNWINNGVENEKLVRLDHLIKKHQLSNIYRISNNNIFTKRNYFQFYGYKIAIIDNHLKPSIPTSKLYVNVLILSKNLQLSIQQILKMYNVTEIIIDASNSLYTTKRLKAEAKKQQIKCWSVLIDGAYSKEI